MTKVHGVLLTGGSSARMGTPKALLEISGETLAKRVSRALGAVADPVVAVGIDARLGLEQVDDPQRGPLWALRAGWDRLEEMGCRGPVLLMGCDLPLVNAGLLTLLVERLDGYGAAVPVVQGRPQPVAACYGPGAGEVVKNMRSRSGPGARPESMADMLSRISVNLVPPNAWHVVAPGYALLDVNTPGELEQARRLAGSPGR
ncbi:MAG: NTP transferase domain-containing protein [Actinobacteria bacterium]|nr:NTP transferase domain-containing protein [Actinomycetota bacterium]